VFCCEVQGDTVTRIA